MANFYTDVILNDSRADSSELINDAGLLEPVTRTAVQNMIEEAKQLGQEFMIFETYRSKQRQEQLFIEHKTQLKQVGVHHYGLACDIVKSVNGKPSWDGSFELLGKLAFKYGLIWGGDWGTPAIHHGFIDADHVQRCSVKQQKALFLGQWYPDAAYNPYTGAITAANMFSLPEPAPLLTVNLVSHNNYADQRLVQLQSALKVVQTVLNSDTFKQNVLNYTTGGTKTFYYRKSLFGRYIDQPYTNDQVYNMIMASKEMVGDVNANSIDLYLELLNGSDGHVIGYGNPGSKEIYTYSVMFDQMSVEDLAGHYSHEWCHKLGFDHGGARSPNHEHSVPYAIGDMVSDIAHSLNTLSDDQSS